MASGPLIATVSVAWWLRPYLGVLAFFCVLLQREPDPDKLERTIRRAIKVRVS